MTGRAWRRLGLVAGVAGLVWALAAATGCAPRFVRSVEVDDDWYYRFRVALTYQGEPQDFDIVVGCNVKQIRYADGGRTYEAGLIPALFGRRMADGRALVVRPPDACDGETTANGKVPADLLPLVVVYDDAETLGFGTAYLSEDAYDSPLSLLRFGGASIGPATRAEFAAFRSSQPNVVTPTAYHNWSGRGSLEARGLEAVAVPMARLCHTYVRFRLSEAARAQVRALWPAERPRYWWPTDYGQLATIDRQQVATDHDGAPMLPMESTYWAYDGSPDQGLATRSGDGQIRWVKGVLEYPPSFYPDGGPWGALPWPADPLARSHEILAEGPRILTSIDFRGGATRGFAYCHNTPGRMGWLFPDDADWRVHQKRPPVVLIDGQRVADVPAGTAQFGLWGGPVIIFERDEFFFRYIQFGLGSLRGEV